MCLFTTRRDDRLYGNWDDPPPHRSYYSAHRGGSTRVARLPEESFYPRRSRSRSREYVVARRAPSREFVVERYPPKRRSVEYVDYEVDRFGRRSSPRLIEYREPSRTRVSREIRYEEHTR